MSSNAITKVALAGAAGNLGSAILKQLLADGFKVTVLTREGSTHTFPASVTVAHVDYDSVDSLAKALKGQDAVVASVGNAALHKQQVALVEAAVKAGVKRFIPSDFGSNTAHPKAAALPAYASKVAVQKLLKEKAAADPNFTYTVVINGPFLDWGVQVGFLVNLKKKQVTLYDGGDRHYSVTTLGGIAKGVAGVLKKPAETANRPVYIQETTVSQRRLYELAQKATGGPDGWTVQEVNTADILAQAEAEKAKDPHSFKFIIVAVYADGYGSLFDKEKLDNELLGIKELTEEEVQEIVNRAA
ncbi:hypothetical protein B0T24DRAFT_137826 [Lasiosphaeria ovina]|uniref:NmrA-like domain-containing protein n=1 Tax=Lasiosphaeria ovina TaxID=92902 RepID=A0AAE0KLJ3_9PEZI|nr:hypothetical protein B0T24DRAFT_137826 [Lasiosphaeria ovina]